MIKISRENSYYEINNNIPLEYRAPKEILLTGGIGDLIALDSHFPRIWHFSVEKIVLATRVADFVFSLYKNKLFGFKNAEVEIIRTNYADPIHNINELKRRTNYKNSPNLLDCSIAKIFPFINRNQLPYFKSSLFDIKQNLDKFNLPEKYIVICPITNHDSICSRSGSGLIPKRPPRNFENEELEEINLFLNNKKIKGVVLHNDRIENLDENNIINLTGETKFIESIGIINNASGFISIDSCLAVLACQIFNKNEILIKSNNKQYYDNIKPYTNPLNTNEMIVKNICAKNFIYKKRNGLIKIYDKIKTL